MTNPNPALRYFQDLALGETIALGHTTVSKDLIIAFAREFDPLPFHLDEAAAKASLLGGLAASGWQTGALSLRLLNDAFLGKVAVAGSLGVSELKWKTPVLVGDTISGTATIATLAPSASRPDCGVVTLAFDMRNQHGKTVLTMQFANLVERRIP